MHFPKLLNVAASKRLVSMKSFHGSLRFRQTQLCSGKPLHFLLTPWKQVSFCALLESAAFPNEQLPSPHGANLCSLMFFFGRMIAVTSPHSFCISRRVIYAGVTPCFLEAIPHARCIPHFSSQGRDGLTPIRLGPSQNPPRHFLMTFQFIVTVSPGEGQASRGSQSGSAEMRSGMKHRERELVSG